MLVSPARQFRKLSLDPSGMAPVTRSQQSRTAQESALEQHGHDGGAGTSTGGDTDTDTGSLAASDGGSDSGSGSEGMDEDDDSDADDTDDDGGPVRSPLTNLLYAVDHLDDDTQDMVRELFRPPPPAETPPLTVEWCGVSNDPDVFAFQLHERVPRAIRIGAPASRIPRPTCNCTGGGDGGAAPRPCRHLVWLLDQIAQQTLPRHPPGRPLVLNASGVPRAFAMDDAGGDGETEEGAHDDAAAGAYARIRAFHIDILANALHCRAGPPTASTGRWPDRQRVREVREILAGLAGEQDAAAPADRPLRRQHHRGGTSADHGLVVRGDLQRTLARLLLANGTFFALFLRLLAPHDAARDPFRKIQQRVGAVLDALQRQQRQQTRRQGAATGEAEPVSVAWAARHIADAAEQIRLLLQQHTADADADTNADAAWARQSAARALVWILHALAARHTADAHAGATPDDRNLYQRLIGNNDGGGGGHFVLLDELALCLPLPPAPAAPWLGRRLERIRRRIQRNGCREPYRQRLDEVLARVRQAEAEAAAAPAVASISMSSSLSSSASPSSSSSSSRASSPAPAVERKRRQGAPDAETGPGHRRKRARGR